MDEVRISPAGDPFYAAGTDEQGEQCIYCGGCSYHFIGSIDEEGEEAFEAVPCRRCGGERS
jgi:hypothetical protein